MDTFKRQESTNNQRYVCVSVADAFAPIRRAGGLFEIGHAGLTVRRRARAGEFEWVRLLPYVDALGSLVNLTELETICRQLPRR